MQNSVATKFSIFILLFFTIISLPSTAFSATQRTNNWLNEPINISFQNEPLSKVLKQISQQTGVSIAYDQELANEKVTGNYQNIKTSDAITRLFRSKNISIQVNETKKVVIVKTFGAKNFIWVGSSQATGINKQDSGVITLADLTKLHAHQFKAYKERIADDNEIIPGGKKPMTRGEIRTMHEQQYKAYKERIANDNEMLEGGEKPMSRGEIRAMHEQQYKAYKERVANDNETLEGGEKPMSRGEIRAMHEQQYKAYKERIADSNEILEGGEKPMSRGEIQTMHEQQYKIYKARQKDRLTVLK